MATLVLSTVGAAFGGPIGATIGATLGQVIDNNILFRPSDREGPRLQDLSVQTSQYGTIIPRLYGLMRVAGTVIWATDFQERREREGRKGQPGTVTYSYSVSLAVALSSRPIRAVHRIWAEGNILRGGQGDFKSPVTFRLHDGHGDQLPDPLIAAAEGDGQAPAFRGMAYAVLEDFDLAPFGNRIPSLSFEVEADAEPLGAYQPFLDLAPIAQTGELARPVLGVAVAGPSAKDALVMARRALPFYLDAKQGGLALSPVAQDSGDPLPVDMSAIVQSDERDRQGAVARSEDAGRAPSSLSFSYFDPDRDYLAGLRRAHASRGHGVAEAIAFPASLDTAVAQQIADDALRHRRQSRDTYTLTLASLDQDWRPGALVQLGAGGPHWRISSLALEEQGVRLELAAYDGGAGVAAGAALDTLDPGRVLAAPDMPIAASTPYLIDLPPDLVTPRATAHIAAAIAADGPGWRGAALLLAAADGTPDQVIASVRDEAVAGHAVSALGAASALLCDLGNSVDVQLSNPEAALADANDAALDRGANLALLGNEVVQFGRAEPLGDGRYRLSRLLRGHGGQEHQLGAHVLGEAFVLLDGRLFVLGDDHVSGSGPISVFALGQGDDAPVSAALASSGAALLPLSPVHLRVQTGDDGALLVGWLRRSRAGGLWRDGVDVPLGEESERYRVTLSNADGLSEAREVVAPQALFYPVIADPILQGALPVTISVQQIGDHGASRPTVLSLT